MNRLLLAAAASLVFLGPAFCQAVSPVAPETEAAAETETVSETKPASKTVSSEAVATPNVDTANVDSTKAAAKTTQSDGFRAMTGNWESASFGGDGSIDFRTIDLRKAETKEGASDRKTKTELIELATGDPLTGVRWTGPLTRENYELRLQARRVEGFDFFVAVTFPVGEEHCSFVVGGWGGGLLGLSSLDGNDAANNETTQFKDFKKGQWYTIRIRVDTATVKCWIDEEEWVNVNREDYGFDIRIEMDPCLPLGLANFQCVSEIKGVAIRKLTANAAAVDTKLGDTK